MARQDGDGSEGRGCEIPTRHGKSIEDQRVVYAVQSGAVRCSAVLVFWMGGIQEAPRFLKHSSRRVDIL